MWYGMCVHIEQHDNDKKKKQETIYDNLSMSNIKLFFFPSSSSFSC